MPWILSALSGCPSHIVAWRRPWQNARLFVLRVLALELGERDDCHGWLIGEPGRGLNCMFQMMNEARLMVGANAVATASVA